MCPRSRERNAGSERMKVWEGLKANISVKLQLHAVHSLVSVRKKANKIINEYEKN